MTRPERRCAAPGSSSFACGCSRRHPELEAEGHVAAQAKRDDIPSEETSEADHMNSTGPAQFVYPGVGVMKQATAIGADERATPADVFLALHATGGGHRAIVEAGMANVDPVSGWWRRRGLRPA